MPRFVSFTRRPFLSLLAMGSLLGAGPVSADIVINEVMQNPSAVADSAGEWFEI